MIKFDQKKRIINLKLSFLLGYLPYKGYEKRYVLVSFEGYQQGILETNILK